MDEHTIFPEKSLKRVLTSIKLSCQFKKFALYFVECSLSVQQKHHLDHLIKQCKTTNINLVHIDVSRDIVKDLRHTVNDRLHKQFDGKIPSDLALIITGFEASILLDKREEQPAVLQVMNLGRENYEKDFPCAFIIFLSDKMLKKVQQVAPDFWSWRSAEPDRFPITVDWIKEETENILSLKPIDSWNDGVERVSLLERVLEAYDEFTNHKEIRKDIQRNRLTFLSRLGDAYRFLEKYQKARRSYEQALDLAKELNEAEEWVALLNKLGIIMIEMKEPDQALDFLDNYLATAKENADLQKQGAALNNIGLIYLDKGEIKKAVETLEEALRLNEETSQTMAIADSLGNLGLAYLAQEDFDNAINYLKRSLEMSSTFKGDRRSFHKDLMNLGTAYFKKGWFTFAAAYYFAARKYCKTFDLIGEKEALIELARCASEDIEPLEQNSQIVREIQSLLSKMRLLTISDGHLGPKTINALKEIDPEEVLVHGSLDTIRCYKEALIITRKIQDNKSEFAVLIELASTLQKQGHFDKAISFYDKALKKAQELSDIKGELACLKAFIQLHCIDEEYCPDKVARYKEKAKLIWKKQGTLKIDYLHIWIMDYENQTDNVLVKDKNYKLCLNMGASPEQLLMTSSQSSFFHTKIEFLYNLFEKDDILMHESKGRGKTTDTEIPEKIRPLPVKSETKLFTPENVESKSSVTIFPDDAIHKHHASNVTVQNSNPIDYETLPEKTYSSDRKKQKPPLEIEVNVEGTGVECEKSFDTIKVYESGSDTLEIPFITNEIGLSSLDIKCRVNDILFEEILPITVEEYIRGEQHIKRAKYIKVFISYSHDSADHVRRVLALSDRLRQEGIDCHNQYEQSPHEGWPQWMEDQIEQADFVLVLCTENYMLRYRGKAPSGEGKGVKWEGAVITHTLYNEETINNRFIPVVFSSQDKDHIPITLKGASFYDLSTDTGYENLYRLLSEQPLAVKPKLGKLKPLSHINSQEPEEFLKSISSADTKPVRLFLSAPDDVHKERKQVNTIVNQINHRFGESLKVSVEVIDWKSHVARCKGQSQEVMNQHIDDHDIFVGVLWKSFVSEEELTLACDNGKHFGRPRMLVYFSQQLYAPKAADEAIQWGKVLTFKAELEQQGCAYEYKDHEQFSELLREHLNKTLQKWFKPEKDSSAPLLADFTHYLKYLRDETKYIDIRGLVTGKGKVHQFDIDELYIPLKTRYGGGLDREVLLEESLREKHLFIKGEPGSGKTTFLRLIACTLCKRELGEDSRFTFSDSPPVPILIRFGPLSRFIRTCHERKDFTCPPEPDCPDWLLHYLESESKSFNWNISSEEFKKELQQGRCMILLDGLDEAPNREVREHLSALASKVVRAYPECQVVMTSRPQAVIGEIEPVDFHPVEIVSLDEASMESFLTKWCSFLYKDAPEKSRQYKEELNEALKSRPEIFRMARTPVMLTALAVVHWNENRLPEQRAELYESILTWLFRARKERAGRLKVDRCRKLLQKLALTMFTHPDGRQRTVDVYWAAQTLAPEFESDKEGRAIDKAERFLEDEMVDSGIIIERYLRLEFWHLSFQEYLAAGEIGGQLDDELVTIVFHDRRLYQSEWREVMFLLAGVLYKSGLARINHLIDAIIDSGPQQASDEVLPQLAKEVGLLGGMERDLSPFDFKPSNPRYTDIVRSVMGIFDKKTFRNVPAEVRIEAADTLGRVGDPRFHRKDDLWIHIPGGSFWMGAQSKNPKGRNYDKNAYDNESPVHKVELSEYWITKYPVTVEQYKRFVDDEGYKKEQFWKAGGFVMFDEPGHWKEQLQHPTRPVVGVSWYEAKAYASWAGCRLPAEAQWERAARGPGEKYRKFPWGNSEPDKETINYGGNVGHPLPVGIFPECCSPEGLIDMAGNVWEWCED